MFLTDVKAASKSTMTQHRTAPGMTILIEKYHVCLIEQGQGEDVLLRKNLMYGAQQGMNFKKNQQEKR